MRQVTESEWRKSFLVKFSSVNPVMALEVRRSRGDAYEKYGGLSGPVHRPWLSEGNFVAMWKVRRRSADRERSRARTNAQVVSDTAQEK